MGTESPWAESDALATLLLTVASAKQGSGHPVVVLGEAGSGKTALVDEMCRQLGPGGPLVLWSSCAAGPDAPILWPWLQVLRQYLRHREGEELPPELHRGMADVIEMVPGIEPIMTGRAVPDAIEVQPAVFRLFDAVTQLVLSAARDRTLVFVLDDLQEADEVSLGLLRHLSAEIAGKTVALVVVCRSPSPRSPSPLRETIDAVARARGTREIVLTHRGAPAPSGGLTGRETQVAHLVAEGLSNREIADRLFISERTAENHVQNILNKLGRTTRAQIATWVTRQEMSTS